MNKIYTKYGDKGYTKIFSGKKLLKSNIRIKALGEVDELNSFCGTIMSFPLSKVHFQKVKMMVLKVQNDLFVIQSILGGSDLKLNSKNVKWLEQNIDIMTNKMPKLNKFIIPRGDISAIFSHIARSICRRAEREITALSKKEKIEPSILKYINRLSDFFFTLARFINHQNNHKEINPKL